MNFVYKEKAKTIGLLNSSSVHYWRYFFSFFMAISNPVGQCHRLSVWILL